tara:strand:- start:2537 stop:2818 length:282 start_codon:yes stop_codon:yes gene_type:complete
MTASKEQTEFERIKEAPSSKDIVSNETLQDIDLVIVYLYGRKEEAIQALFGHSNEAYQKEWRDRSVAEFWRHLDPAARREVVKLARKMGEWEG